MNPHPPMYTRDQVVWFVVAPFVYLGDSDREAVLDGRVSGLPPWESHFRFINFKKMVCTGHTPNAFDPRCVGRYSFVNCDAPHDIWHTWQPQRKLPANDTVPWMIIQENPVIYSNHSNSDPHPPIPLMTDLSAMLTQLRNDRLIHSGIHAGLANSRFEELCERTHRDCGGLRVVETNDSVMLQQG